MVCLYEVGRKNLKYLQKNGVDCEYSGINYTIVGQSRSIMTEFV